MAIVLWGFLGAFILEPLACGAHGCTKETFIEICYVWKVFCYKIGIDDEYSLIRDLDYDLIYTMCKLVFEQEFLPYLENCNSKMGDTINLFLLIYIFLILIFYIFIGIRMAQGTTLALQQVITYYKFKSFVGYWYKVLNINAYKLNRANLDSDKYEFPNEPLKTELTDKDKELMIKNGYNLKYVVQNPDLPFEEIELDTFADKINQYVYKFFVNVVFRFQTIRNFLNKSSYNINDKLLNGKQNITEMLKENFDDHMNYPACPFTGFIKSDYAEFTDLK